MIELWVYGGTHGWQETAFVATNLAIASIALLIITIIEWGYHGDKQKFWNDGNSTYYDDYSHRLGIYLPRRIRDANN